MSKSKKKTLGVVLYPGFELLDVYGPVEMFGNLPELIDVIMVAERAGAVRSAQGPQVVAEVDFDSSPSLDLILVPGGIGSREEVNNEVLLTWLTERAADAEIVASVCTGSAILAKAGLLDGRRATSNKQAFKWVVKQGPKVQWVKQARWVDDGDRVTSSGVTAGMDMTLAIIERLFGTKTAEALAKGTEYEWHRDASWDPFSKLYD
ncbi:MAG: DJ-1/PfpI family protein [Candidatus Hydrogenedentes bacterium]|nr:DJ-1/PfpI family protein [Candidatus Hydrogenedentota bacterium]